MNRGDSRLAVAGPGPGARDPAVPAGQAGAPAVAAGTSPEEEARAFWQMRLRIAITLVQQTFAGARLRLGLVLVLSAVLWLGIYWMFADGFRFLRQTIADSPTHDQTVRAVFGMFFAALMVMLAFSSGIILYGSLFRSRDVPLLLTIPARAERVFLHKFQEAVLWSSWGFLLLGSPMLLAYGVIGGAPWYYYAMLPAFLLTFTYLMAGVGAMACMSVVWQWPEHGLRVAASAGVLVLAGGAWLVWSVIAGPQNDLLTIAWLQEVLGRLQFTEGRLLPSWWLSSGLLEAARGAWSEGVLFLVVLTSNALMCRQLAIWLSGRIYRPAYSALCVRKIRRRRARPGWIDRALLRACSILPLSLRLLIVKDVRIFRRDPVQWSQFLIFLGLLALYFVNIRRFRYDVYHAAWVNMISFLNLLVVGLLMSTFTTRFVFPLISLEGRRYWILGLLPLRRETILWSKFLFAVGGLAVPCAGLILLSDVMLQVSPMVLAMHQLTCLILCLGLSGIAVGLGARLPNLREQSPSRIAAGFGGTLNLVVSGLYIVAVVLLTALPCHFYLVAKHARTIGPLGQALRAGEGIDGGQVVDWWIQLWLIGGVAGSVVLAAMVTTIPLWIGFRAFRSMEFY